MHVDDFVVDFAVGASVGDIPICLLFDALEDSE